MKLSSFLVFISIVLTIYLSVNYYIYLRGLKALPKDPVFQKTYLIIFLVLAISFWAGRILEKYYLSTLSDIFVWIGAFWLACMLYFFLFILLFDLLRLLNYFTGFFPAIITANYEKSKLVSFFSVIALTFIIIIAGYLNSRNPVIKELRIDIHKNAGELQNLNIVAASDLHLGTMIGKSRVEKITSIINSLNPDIVLFPGDVIDEDIRPVLRRNLGEAFLNIRSKYGVFSSTGNHEYIGGINDAVKYLEDHNISVLRDTALLIENSFYLVGREDSSITTFTGKRRKPLSNIVDSLNKDLPLLLLDHQPLRLFEAEKNGIDLQLSGHTHHGQLWPLNYITGFIYEISWGYGKKNNSQYYVSCGAGIWGPPVRIGSRPEILNIKIRFLAP